jgi:alanine racemase
MTLAPTWMRIDERAVQANVAWLRSLLKPGCKLGVVVKADAYGHGAGIMVPMLVRAGVDWLIVNSAAEAEHTRALAPHTPIYSCGPLLPHEASTMVHVRVRSVVSTLEVVEALAAAARSAQWVAPVHVKVETGTTRQGVKMQDVIHMAHAIAARSSLRLEGITTHFADIEDTTDHRFADKQHSLLQEAATNLRAAGIDVPMVHAANSAATLLDARTHGDMVRVGIAAYGLWPSKETLAAFLERRPHAPTTQPPTLIRSDTNGLQPVMSWHARITQVKDVPAGAYVGYGRTFRTTHASRIAIVPVGYHEGYDRRLSNTAHVLVDGVRAPVRGRVCMNMMMVDVTDVPSAKLGSEVVLLGKSGDEDVSAEQLAAWMGSIHYEVVARIHPLVPRVALPMSSAR